MTTMIQNRTTLGRAIDKGVASKIYECRDIPELKGIR
jgi:hypothetical protein